jgi:hypothetical protein
MRIITHHCIIANARYQKIAKIGLELCSIYYKGKYQRFN